ncbi:MAG TPA: polysaccharide deacetylase family protein [Bryobacteraceae bacterium]|jgi:peptidoglycan/xylan/chitin deacetylase (PgdA/CDA1 family)|nr:polysaccharide deacetylase family protein [Bryobacteraceae bacterium]
MRSNGSARDRRASGVADKPLDTMEVGMIVTTSWDDGDVLDERLADLLDRHGIRGTFYMTRRYRRYRLPDDRIRALAESHEIGAHTLTHPDLRLLSHTAKANEVEGSKHWLEDVIGKPVSMFCYPFGRFDAATKSSVLAAGFQGARTTRQFSLVPTADRLAIATTLHVHPLLLRRDNMRDFSAYLLRSAQDHSCWHDGFVIGAAMLRGWLYFAETLFRISTAQPQTVFHLWGHSWEIEASGMWKQLDTFLEVLSSLSCRFKANGDL